MPPAPTKIELETARPGEALYETVSRTILRAVEDGVYVPGERMPTTEQVSRALSVSLVTTHRALHNLVTEGVLERIRGKGTFVVENHEAKRPHLMVGVLSHAESSMGDHYHGRILDGMRQAAFEHRVNLVLIDYREMSLSDAAGYVLINPVASELDDVVANMADGTPLVVVGAHPHRDDVPAISTDNRALAAAAIDHLYKLGHRRIGFVGGGAQLGDSRDRLSGFVSACDALNMTRRQCPVLDVPGYRLTSDEKIKLTQMLKTHDVTAVFAGGYYLALDVYEAASTVGLEVPDGLTVVGVDDPSSASRLHPPLTTFRQPLLHMGFAAIAAIRRAHQHPDDPIPSESMQAELLIRRSSGTPRR